MLSYLDPSSLPALITGVAVSAAILAAYFAFAPDPKAATVKKRMEAVKSHRRELRDARINKAQKAEREVQMMRNLLKKLRLETLISDPALKAKLASAGLRNRGEAVRFVFKKIAFPPLFALGAYLYITTLMADEGWGTDRLVMACVGAAALGYFLPDILLHNAATKRQQDILRAYPDALDLLTICVESGMSVEQSFNRVAQEIGAQSIALSEELQITTAELSYLGDRRLAFENFAIRTGLTQVKAITSALIQTERYGTPIGQALRVISAESRDDRMNRAEQKAASLPAKLTVPMMVFFVPVLFVVILGPAVIQIMEMT